MANDDGNGGFRRLRPEEAANMVLDRLFQGIEQAWPGIFLRATAEDADDADGREQNNERPGASGPIKKRETQDV